MPQLYTAFASEVKVNEETIEGLQAIEYTLSKNRRDVGAIGTAERVGVYFGLQVVVGRLRVASANLTLDRFLQENTRFSISATLKHEETSHRLTFDDCFMEDKSFGMDVESHGSTVYTFTATRVREE